MLSARTGKFLQLLRIGRWQILTQILAKISLLQISLTYIAYFSRSIVIAAIGFATNIADLLRSGADDHSPLSGKRFFCDFLFCSVNITKNCCTTLQQKNVLFSFIDILFDSRQRSCGS